VGENGSRTGVIVGHWFVVIASLIAVNTMVMLEMILMER